MQFIPSADFPTTDYRVQAKLYDALEAFRVADHRIEGAMKEGFGDHDDDPTPTDFCSIQASCRVFGALLEQMVSGAPTVKDSVFKAIASHENLDNETHPHIEAITMAMILARISLATAINLSIKHDGDEADDAYMVMEAALYAAEMHGSLLSGMTHRFFAKQALKAILDGEAMPDLPELRRRWIIGVQSRIKKHHEEDAALIEAA